MRHNSFVRRRRREERQELEAASRAARKGRKDDGRKRDQSDWGRPDSHRRAA